MGADHTTQDRFKQWLAGVTRSDSPSPSGGKHPVGAQARTPGYTQER